MGGCRLMIYGLLAALHALNKCSLTWRGAARAAGRGCLEGASGGARPVQCPRGRPRANPDGGGPQKDGGCHCASPCAGREVLQPREGSCGWRPFRCPRPRRGLERRSLGICQWFLRFTPVALHVLVPCFLSLALCMSCLLPLLLFFS